jgi:membrane-bound lytic murein transglycosylase D
MKFTRNYIKKSSDNLGSIKHRSAIPFDIIDSVFTSKGLPLELKYLAVIESELKSSAVSRVGAVGPWQLMPATARILGLKVNRHQDERKNYYKSTCAAAIYLKDLYTEFGDWLLVLAAYNGGPGPVNSAMRKSGSKNFWKLQQYLPHESSDHVKKFLATRYYFEGQSNQIAATNDNKITQNSFAVYNPAESTDLKDSVTKQSHEETYAKLAKSTKSSAPKSKKKAHKKISNRQ